MKLRILAVVSVLAIGVTVSRANITGVTLSPYAGAMTCSNTDVSPVGDPNTTHTFTMGVEGQQHDLTTASLEYYVYTDSPGDPNLNLAHTINNDTLTPWTDYHVQVTMGQFFTFADITVTNAGWTFSPTGAAPVGPNWVGSIDFFASGPSTYINPGDSLGFSFTLGFVGPVSFSENLTPSIAPVPEPSAIALLACGLMGLFVIQRRLGT